MEKKFLFPIILMLIFISLISCNSSNLHEKITNAETITLGSSEKLIFEKLQGLSNGQFKLVLNTIMTNDTLGGEWEDEIYGNPVIKKQYLTFYKNNVETKKYFLPIEKVDKTLKNSYTVSVAQIPILDICLLDGSHQDFYFAYGADFCNGINCPEFIGIYTMDGEVIEEWTTEDLVKEPSSLKDIQRKNGIDINKSYSCQSILDYWKTNYKVD